MRNIKVALILFKTDLTGGPGRSILNSFSLADRQKFNYTAIAPLNGPLTESLKAMGVSIKIIPMPVISKYKPWEYLWAVFTTWRYFRQEQIQIAHFNLERWRDSVLLAAYLAGVKSILHIRGPATDYERAWLCLADFFIFNSKYTKDFARFNKVPEVNQKVIYNGIDSSSFKPQTGEKANLSNKLNPQISLISRLHPAKNIEYALKAFAKVRSKTKANLFIAGNFQVPDYVSKLKKLARELEIDNDITFAGHIDNLTNVYSKTDILLHTATTEAFGNIFLEAAIFSIPTVAFEAGGIPEVVQNGVSGILVPAENIEALADALLELLSNPEKATQMGVAANSRLAMFTTAAYQQEVESVYQTVLQSD